MKKYLYTNSLIVLNKPLSLIFQFDDKYLFSTNLFCFLIIAFIFIFQYLGSVESIKTVTELTLINYIVIILVMLTIMFFVARWDYVKLYNNVYEESANSRIDIANRLKKLPLSYFGRRDLADLAASARYSFAYDRYT